MEWKPFLSTLLAFLVLVLQAECADSDIKDAFGDLSLQDPEADNVLGHPIGDQNDLDLLNLDDEQLQELMKRGSLFRFGKRGGSLFRFGKRGSLFRFGKRGGSSLFRYGKRNPDDVSLYDLISNGEDKRAPTIFRYGKRAGDSVNDFLNRYNKRQSILRYGRSADKRPHTPFRFGREEDE